MRAFSGGIRAVDGVALDRGAEELADGAVGGLGHVGRAHHFAQRRHRIGAVGALERHRNDRTFGHEGDQAAEERALAVDGVERLRLRLA